MYILVAEDDIVSNEVLASTLQEWGHDVVSVMDGNAAWEALQQPDAPKLAILDWMMPGVSGVELCERIRSQNGGSYTYILLLTSKTTREDLIRGLDAGADDYVTKPFDPQELKVRLNAGKRILELEAGFKTMLNQLKENEDQRRNFISALTHDLRSPLSSEKRALEVIKSCESEISSRVSTLVESLIKNNDNLLSLVNQLLESFQYECGRIQLNHELVNLRDIVSKCFLGLLPLAQSKHIRLVNSIGDGIQPILADPEQLLRLLTNLVSNAIHNIDEQCLIEVTAQTVGDFLKMEVRDNGQGIPLDLIPHLFERYYTSSSGGNKVGSGLGLSICKTIVELHGGKIKVDSTQGKGSCFYFTLPRKTVKQSLVEEQPLQKFSVLIVEDQELARTGLQFSLEGEDSVKVVGLAENGKVAITQVEKLKPQIVLMDIVMPEMDGIEATRYIKAQFPNVKVVMLTSQSDAKQVFAALSAGADGYCMKDIKTHRLVEAMHQVAGGHRWLDSEIAAYVEQSLVSPEEQVEAKPAPSASEPAFQILSEASPAVSELMQNLAIPPVSQATLQSSQAVSSEKTSQGILNDNELQVIRLLAAHNTLRDIADIMYMDVDRINSFLASALTKLASGDIDQAIQKAKQQGLFRVSRS